MYRNHNLNMANRRAHDTNDRCCMKQSNKTSDLFVKNHKYMCGKGIDYMKGLDRNAEFSFIKQHFNKLEKELAGIAYERGMVVRKPINKYAINVPSFNGRGFYVDSKGFQHWDLDDPRAFDYRMFE